MQTRLIIIAAAERLIGLEIGSILPGVAIFRYGAVGRQAFHEKGCHDDIYFPFQIPGQTKQT